jgi:hypothetical protein
LKPFNYFWLKFVKVKVENPVALRFILQDELYLLNTDKPLYENIVMAAPIAEEATPIITEAMPIARQPEPVIAALQPEVKTLPVSFNYLGKNLKNFLVLVHYPDLDFIDETHLTALINIIKRKELAIDDLAIVNLAKQVNTHYDELIKFFKPAKLLVLGNKALPQGIPPLVLNTPKSLNGSTSLYSFAFGEMMESTDDKKAFWEQMKTL